MFNLYLFHFSSSRILVVTLTALDSNERQVTISHSVVPISQSDGHDEYCMVCIGLSKSILILNETVDSPQTTRYKYTFS